MTDRDFSQYPPGVQVVLNVLDKNGIPFDLRVFDSPARQASQAAALINSPLGAIVKSLVFQEETSCKLIMVLVSGQNRADPQALSKLTGEKVRPAQPEVILAETGYPVGSVPPLGLQGEHLVVMDADLLGFEQVWASAGAEHILFGLTPKALQGITLARVEHIKGKRG